MPIRNIIVYSKTLPPEHVGGIETNGYNFIQYLAGQPQFNLVVVTQKAKLARKGVFQRQSSAWVDYGGSCVLTFFQTKKYFKRVTNVLALFSERGFLPGETVIFHNSLDLYDSYATLRKAGYHQIGRSGGNDIFFMQNHPETGTGFIRSMQMLDRLFVNSQYSLERSREAGIPGEMMDVIKGGCLIPPPRLARALLPGFSTDTPVVISCGRLVDFKGIDDALEALAQVKRAGVAFHYLLVGDGDDRKVLEEKARTLGLDANVCFLGKVQPDQINNLYQAADLYLSTSKGVIRNHNGRRYLHTETMGRSLCEAQANGLPAVTTDAGGSAEMVRDGETGLVVKEGSVSEIARALTALLQDAVLRKQMGANAYRYAAEELSWDAVFGRYVATMSTMG